MSRLALSSRQLGYILAGIYLFSGGISLTYEILWTRMLSLQFGVSIFGVVATVTAYMMGLGFGSFLGARWSSRINFPMRWVALLEFVVALLALSIPIGFQWMESVLSGLASQFTLSAWISLQMFIVILVLMLPALAMGAGFPLILSAVQETKTSLGVMYGVNALGGAIGALLPLWLLPVLGWLSAMQFVAGVGFALGALLLLLSLLYERSRERKTAVVPVVRPPVRWLIVYAGIGAAALLLEIGWTRLFGMVLLRTEYVLAIILAVFLVGIGLGSLIARLLYRPIWFTVLPLIASGFAVFSLWGLPELAAWVEAEKFASLPQAMWLQGMAIASLTLPVTLVLGAWLPLLAAKLGNRYQSGVWLYGANSIGAGVGTLTAGFVFIPGLGTSATIVMGAFLLLVLGLSWSGQRLAWACLPALLLFAYPVMQMPSVAQLMPQAYADARHLSLHEDAIAITHVVERRDGQRQLLADLRRMDASSEPSAVVVQMNQARLPLLLHPEPKRVLFLGLGTGISAAGSLAYPAMERVAVELSAGAIQAARHSFREVNASISDHLTIVRDDARHYLMSDSSHYDVVIGDLFHPDLVGRSALLSKQQFERARARLTENGLFVQWLALNQFDTKNLQVVLRTFRQVFPNAVMFVDAFRLAMVGFRNGSLQADQVLHNLNRLSQAEEAQATGGEGGWTWLGRYWGKIPVSSGPVQGEWQPVIEYSLPGARYSGDLDLVKTLSWLLSVRPNMDEARAQLSVAAADRDSFEGAYAATELAHRSWVALLRDRPQEGQRLLPLAYQANPRDRWVGFALADGVLADRAAAEARGVSEQQLLESILRIRPDHVEAVKGLWRLAVERGDEQAAAMYRDRLASLSPFDSDLKRWANDLH